MVRCAGPVGGATEMLLILATLCILPEMHHCQQALVLDDFRPRSGPISGGTQINVTGSGFITTGADRSKCRFELPGRGNMLSTENAIHNETSLTCVLPKIEFFTESQLQGGNRMVRLSITGNQTAVSNNYEFFLYDLDRIRVWSISPTEGLVNSTNITLSITGENFLDTDELSCSVTGSRKVPAQFINSASLRCLLVPFPQTTQVTIDISMNGQAVANIPPLSSTSTVFTYFASPPRIQSCRFTPSYAQLLLTFDREVEIGEEERPDTFTPSSITCDDVFSYDTLQNLIGQDSTCHWLNTAQRQVVVQLASNNLVQLGLTVVLSDKSIRTRYVRYSRLAGGEVSISLPEVDAPQFLPVAIIEAPSTIPYCGNFTISGAKSQHGGSRGLEYKWTVGTDYNENGTLIQDSVLADYIPTGFTHQSLLELSSDLFNPDLLGSGSGITPITLASSFDTQLDVRNFLGFTSTAHIANLTRAELQLPSVVIIGGDVRRIRISDETILEGRIVLPDGCPIEEEFMTRVTYAWRVADQFNTGVTFVDPSRSSLLVLPPNLLEMGSEYTATLSVGFGTLSAVVEGSVRLVTGVELVARLANGVKRSVGVNEDISLDGRTSQFINTSSAMLGISWKCGMIDSIDNCIDRHGQYLTLSNDSLVQIIPSGMLLPGEYNFTLTLNVVSNSDILEASTYQIVVIFPFMVPRVKIVPDLGTDLESVLVQNELILNVQVQSDTPGTAQWTSEYVIGYAQVDFNDNRTVRFPLEYNITEVADSQRSTFSEKMPVLFTSNSHSTPSSFTNIVTLILTANSLLPQNSYKIKFTAVDELGNAGFSEIDIHTESVPTSGHLLISPPSGSPLTTVFLLSALGWTDDLGDTPLLYRFGLRYIYNLPMTLLPPCCSLMYNSSDNTPFHLENVLCMCDFWSTGISEQNELLTTLPLQPEQGRTGRLVQVQQLVHIFDKNGAVTEASQTLDDFNNEKSSEEDSSKLLQPLSDSQREDLDVLALLDRIRRLATTNWRESLAQLTTLVSTVDTNTFVTSSSFNITSTMMSQFKVKATELVLDIYNSYIPISKSYLNVVAGILHSTTSSPDSAGISSNEALVSRIVDFLRALVDSYNSFDVNKILGFSTMDSQVVLQTFHKLINPSQQKNSSTISRVRENLVTQTLLGLIPKLGQGLCLREKYSFVNGAGVAFLKASRTNLPMDYKSTEQCNMKQPTSKRARFCSNDALPEVTVNFSLALFERYLWWNCANETEGTESYCSGICLTSAQYSQDLLWQGTPYTSQLKSPLFQLYLLNPHNGSVLEVSSTATESQTRVTRNSELASDQLDITFPILASYSNASNLHCAYWNVTSRLWISKLGFSGETTERNGTVTDKLCHFRTSLGSFFTVLERCPDGYYGEACLQVCPEGLWGEECRGSCDCNDRGDCSPVDGSCDCNPGWVGDECQTSCPAGRWGKYCLETCLCENGADCDHVTGSCACTPGWMGTFCNTSCPDGLYGNDCREKCTCNAIEECDKTTGACNCSTGFTGPTCHDVCPTGFYGDSCASECQCFAAGTRSCHNVNGSCDCFAEWMGDLCNVEITPPPEPAFQIWWVVVGLVAAILLAVVVVFAIIIVVVYTRKKKRKKVLPITDDETGDQVSHHKHASDEVAASSSGSDLNITKAKSLEVLVPKGKELTDIFISPTTRYSNDEEETEFREPSELGGKLRWQIIRLMPSSKSKISPDREQDTPIDSVQGRKTELSVDKTDNLGEDLEEMPDSSLEVSKITQESPRSKYSEEGRNESEDDHMSEILYKRGVYLAPDATLKDLRNGFIELENLETNDRYFQLLRSDVPGDFIEIDTEEEVLLNQIEHTLVQPRTMYIENVDPATVTVELCVCGKFADMECSECGGRGYCCIECQQNDWLKHILVCQEKSEERRRRKASSKSRKKKKKKHKKHKKHRKSKSRESKRSRNYTPSIDVCVCGKEAEFECSGCDKQGYCSEECQKRDWDVHHMFCIPSLTITPADVTEEESFDDSNRTQSTPVEITPLRRTSLETLIEEPEESEAESKTII